MRLTTTTVFLGILAACAAAATARAQQVNVARPANADDAMSQDYVVAIVNDRVVTHGQVRKVIVPLLQGIGQEVDALASSEAEARAEFNRRVNALQREIIHNRVDQLLMIEEFERRGTIPPAYLDLVFENSITMRFKGDHEAYLRYLQANGLTEREYRRELAENIMVDHLRSELRKSITGISPDRIKTYYEKNREKFHEEEAVKLRQITLKPGAGETPDFLLQQANYIVQQARAPSGDFAALARNHSNDDYRASGGEAGYFGRRQLLPVLEEAVFKLEPGQVSDPIVVNGNVFIFKLEEKRKAGIQPLDTVRRQIESVLAIEDTREAEQKWLARLRKNAYIHYNLAGME